jgi:MFS superfamily sulfate permease-like transporter
VGRGDPDRGDALPTVLFAVAAYGLIAGLRRLSPAIPGVLIAVLATAAVSTLIGFEHKTSVPIEQIRDDVHLQGDRHHHRRAHQRE